MAGVLVHVAVQPVGVVGGEAAGAQVNDHRSYPGARAGPAPKSGRGLPNVSMRVVPFSAGFHLGMLTGGFTLLRFPLNGSGTETEPDTVYSDSFTGAIYLDKPGELARYSRAFAEIWETSLDED